MKLYLDDIRPCPTGYVLARTIEQAKAILAAGGVTEASLDHDLGACAECMSGKTVDQWLEESGYQTMPHCGHVGTGYDLVCWMEETGHWPETMAYVHSANPVGRARMQVVIDRHYARGKEGRRA